MKLNYYADTDSLYIDLSERTSVESREISTGVVLDYDAEENLVGIDIDNASRKVDQNNLLSISYRRLYKLTQPSFSPQTDPRVCPPGAWLSLCLVVSLTLLPPCSRPSAQLCSLRFLRLIAAAVP